MHVTSPFVTINQSTLTAQQTAGFAASGYTAPTTFFITNPTTGPHWQIWEGDDDDLVYDQRFTSGAANVSALIRNWVKRVPGDGAYTATEVLGIIVGTAPTSDDTAITPIGGTAQTSLLATMFPVSDRIPIHASSVTVGTGGVFYLVIPDA